MTVGPKDLFQGLRNRGPAAWPAVFSYGFRPFFLLGSFYAGFGMLAWLPIFSGRIETASLFAPVDWHVHEIMFGYLAAVMTGFLLTAIPNWTGRLPVRNLPLLGLVMLWMVGRAAVFFSAEIGWVTAAVVDCAFLAAVVACATTEIIVGRNWQNLLVVVPVILFLFANVLFHLETGLAETTDYARRLAIGVAVMLILIVGGRIIPSFTRNWLVRENPGQLPVAFNGFDKAVLLVSAVALLAWTLTAEGIPAGTLLFVAALFNLVRLARWVGYRSTSDALVLILHIAYLFVPLGLLMVSLAAFAPADVPPAAAFHALGTGAIGTMTLAVMTRATLGHTGRDLKADVSTQLIYAAIMLAALTRILAGFMPGQTELLHLSAGLWAFALLGFCLRYGPMLLRPRLKPRRPSQPPGRPG